MRWLVALVLVLSGEPAKADTCLGFISPNCCCTRGCCWQITANDVIDLGNSQYRIRVTGQVMNRTSYSPDGNYYRCACRPVGTGYVRDPHHNTTCLYTPTQLF